MVHHERAPAAKLVPDGKGRTKGAACIARSRLHVHAPERRLPPHLAVGDGVHRASTCQREVGQSEAFLQDVKEMKERFLIHRLARPGDVAMAALERVSRQAPWPQQLLKRGRKQIAEFRGTLRPLISDVLAMMTEKFQVQREPAIWEQTYNFSQVIEV